MPFAQLSLSTVNAVCQTYEGKDKLIRFFQFASRGLMGATADSNGYMRVYVNKYAKNTMTTLSGARRAFRWGRELPVLLNLPNTLLISDPFDRYLELSQKVTLLTFFLIDHLAFLKQLSNRARGAVKTIQLGLKFLAVSSLLGAVCGMRKLRRLSLEPGSDGQRRTSELNQCALGVIRNGLLAFQVSHMSRWWVTSDVLVGLLGMFTSVVDIIPVWPRVESTTLAKASQEKCQQVRTLSTVSTIASNPRTPLNRAPSSRPASDGDEDV
eukprot:TRINITY_DN63306_c0_g1_i1.p1 TRINITY_DN63306_c0_g1~~TRINITY_DN63306_c0_g1_i1.p1  ORF type:complete len:268 (+),score=2.98 TRINITY_DN63306_c0_g1_i1:103-906(+)